VRQPARVQQFAPGVVVPEGEIILECFDMLLGAGLGKSCHLGDFELMLAGTLCGVERRSCRSCS
jgi:hypothetical protein